MVTPTKSEIVSRAKELWHEQRFQDGDPSFGLNPEELELREGGFLSVAISDLMRSPESKNANWFDQKVKAENFEKTETEISTEIPFNVTQALDTGFFISGTSQSGKSNLAKFLVETLMQSGIVCYVIDPSRAWLHNSPISSSVEIYQKIKQVDWHGSTVFDVSTLSVREAITFTNTLCSSLNEMHINGETTSKEFVIFEEGQLYLPCGGMRLGTRRNSPLEGVFKLVTVGANFGLRFGIVTQFPALIDKSCVKITQQRYYFWTWEKNDVQYLKAFLGKTWSEKLGTLQKGECLAQNRMNISQIRTPIFRNAEQQQIKIGINGKSNGWYKYELPQQIY